MIIIITIIIIMIIIIIIITIITTTTTTIISPPRTTRTITKVVQNNIEQQDQNIAKHRLGSRVALLGCTYLKVKHGGRSGRKRKRKEIRVERKEEE